MGRGRPSACLSGFALISHAASAPGRTASGRCNRSRLQILQVARHAGSYAPGANVVGPGDSNVEALAGAHEGEKLMRSGVLGLSRRGKALERRLEEVDRVLAEERHIRKGF